MMLFLDILHILYNLLLLCFLFSSSVPNLFQAWKKLAHLSALSDLLLFSENLFTHLQNQMVSITISEESINDLLGKTQQMWFVFRMISVCGDRVILLNIVWLLFSHLEN